VSYADDNGDKHNNDRRQINDDRAESGKIGHVLVSPQNERAGCDGYTEAHRRCQFIDSE
jgi:hypothetical protein